jgi:hypothetical protein
MPDLSTWALPGALLAAAGATVIYWQVHRAAKPRKAPPISEPKAITVRCSVCDHAIVFTVDQLAPLSAPETGLVVSARPEVVGKKLYDYVCPHCETSHCFTVNKKKPEWIGENMYQPEVKGARCMECKKPLKAPPWPRGTYDDRFSEVPHLEGDTGLECTRCDAIACATCAKANTLESTFNGAYRCCRCSRMSLDKIFHP